MAGNIWATLVPIIQGAIVVGLLAVVGLFFVPVIQKQNGYKDQIAETERKIAAAQEEQAQLKLETEHMKNDAPMSSTSPATVSTWANRAKPSSASTPTRRRAPSPKPVAARRRRHQLS